MAVFLTNRSDQPFGVRLPDDSVLVFEHQRDAEAASHRIAELRQLYALAAKFGMRVVPAVANPVNSNVVINREAVTAL